MDAFFSQLEFWHWFAFAVLLIIVDVATGANFLFLWSGIAAALVGVLLLIMPKMGWEYQLMIFGLGVMSSILVWFFFLRKHKQATDQPKLNLRNEQYIDRVFDLDEPIVNGRGKVRVGDTWWKVKGADLPQGTKVKVVAVDGVILIVEKVE